MPSTDILKELKDWRDQLVRDKPFMLGQLPEVEIDLLNRAIEEIERLRG
jgi:hypothetical protein